METCSVLTWNTMLHPVFASKNPSHRVGYLHETIEERRPTVVMLQEAFNMKHRRVLRKKLERMGYDFGRPDTARWYHTEGGLMTGTLLPVSSCDHHTFNQQSGHFDESGPWTKEYEEMMVDLHGCPAQLINTHLPHRREDLRTRAVNIRQMIGAIRVQNEREPKTDVILGGDLNFRTRGLEHYHLEKSGLHDSVVGHEKNFVTFPGENARLDYVFFRSSAGRMRPIESSLVGVGPDAPSDHYGYEATFAVRKAA